MSGDRADKPRLNRRDVRGGVRGDIKSVQRVYLFLLTLQTLSASLIWGVNTLFLLDAGLSNFEAFGVNAFFTLGMVLFEIPTGVIADSFGRRLSYLLGTVTLIVTTALYVLLWKTHASLWAWALVSIGLGLGFTFFSGAVDAWLVDAMADANDADKAPADLLERTFGRGQIVIGASTLIGSVAGGYIAQISSLGMPYLIRVGFLVINLVAAFFLMFDRGFTPPEKESPLKQMRSLLRVSIDKGFGNPSLKWMMLTSPFLGGVMFYVFYAMQPYLLALYGDKTAYGIAGLAAAIVAGAQMVGGASVGWVSRRFQSRVSLILAATILGSVFLTLMFVLTSFWITIVLLVVWALIFAVVTPVRQTYLNKRIESKNRATLLSFDSVLNSAGSVVTQPALGKTADLFGYPASYLTCAVLQACAIPLLIIARRYDAGGGEKTTSTISTSER